MNYLLVKYTKSIYKIRCLLSGRSSVVEHNLAKVGVVSSNLIARSRKGHVLRSSIGI